MKKNILLILSFFSFACVTAQDLQSYVQFGIGANFEHKDWTFQGEYGKTYKWLDVSVSVAYEAESWNNYNTESYARFLIDLPNQWVESIDKKIPNNLYSGSNSTSLSLSVRFDIVELFEKDSRHSVKIGGGVGCGFMQYMVSSYSHRTQDEVYYSYSMDNNIRLFPIVRASYEYDITKNLALGGFFYFGGLSQYWGLSIRRNF
jgi:hypothetical protein